MRLLRDAFPGISELPCACLLYTSDKLEDVKASTIYRRKIIFTPGFYFKDMLTRASVEKMDWSEMCIRDSSVDLAGLEVQTLRIYLFLMRVGGGSQSTAGGIKGNAFAVVVLNLVAVLRLSLIHIWPPSACP